MSRRLYHSAVGALLGALACSPSGERDALSITLTPEGGRYEAAGVVIELPPRAVLKTTPVRVLADDEELAIVPGRVRSGLTYRFEPPLMLDRQARVTLPYLAERVPAGVDPRTLDLRRRSEDESASPLPDAVVDARGVVVGASSNRLTSFWVTAPARAVGLKLKLEPDRFALDVGERKEVKATLTDAAGNPVEGVPLTWTVVPSRVARAAKGVVTAAGPGRAVVRVVAGPAIAEAELQVIGRATGPTSFQYDNPFPTGNDLWAARQVGSDWLFAGANGTVLAYEAGQWRPLYTAAEVTLYGVDGADAQHAVAVGVAGLQGVLVDVATQRQARFDGLRLSAVSYDGTLGLAAGRGADVLLFASGNWRRVPSPTAQVVLAVRREAASFTVVGDRGSIYRLDADAGLWQAVDPVELAVRFDFATLSGNTGWAIGAGYLWEWKGAGWVAQALPEPHLQVTALGTLEGQLAIGVSDGRVLVRRGTGVFATLRLRGPQRARVISGGLIAGDHGAIWQSFSGSVTEVSRGFYDWVVDVSAAPGVVVAATNDCDPWFCPDPHGKVMVRRGPAQWEPLGEPFGSLSSVLALSANEIYAGGSHGVRRWNGMRWVDLQMGEGVSPYVSDLAICGTRLYASSGTSVFAGPRSGPLVAGEAVDLQSILAIACPSADSLWKAGPFGMFENAERRDRGKVASWIWKAVWSPGPNEAFVFGAATYGGYWNGEELVLVGNPGGPDLFEVRALWGTSFDNLYLAGSTWSPVRGYVARFDGLLWKPVECGAQRPLHAMGGTTQLWLGGEGGAILRGVGP